jgi:hypothetical protein
MLEHENLFQPKHAGGRHWAPGEICRARASFEFSFILFLHLFSEDFPFPAPTPPLNSNLRTYNPPLFQ